MYNLNLTYSIPIQWIGGKYRLMPTLAKYAPKHFNRYYECFAGSLALMWYLHPKHVTINDVNPELTNFFHALATHYFTPSKVYLHYPSQFLSTKGYSNLHLLMRYFETKNNHDDYFKIRNLDQTPAILKLSSVERAARLVYLDKTGFNGIVRFSHTGYHHGLHENIPWGRHTVCHLVTPTTANDARYLSKIDFKIDTGDFEKSIQNAQPHDFIYADPPYLKRTDFKTSFNRYTRNGFTFNDQKRLAKIALDFKKKHIYMMLSNAESPLIKKLYPSKYFHIHHINIHSDIARTPKNRIETGEVIITNY